MPRKVIFISLIIFFLSISIAESKNERITENGFCLKQVIEDSNLKVNNNYEYGRELYPRYKESGLSNDFLIKKVPDLCIDPVHIKEIRISKQPPFPGAHQSYEIKITFDKLAASEMIVFTKSNLKKRIAMEVDGEIISIAPILDPIEDVLIIFVASEKSIQEMKAIYFRISKNIIVESSQDKIRP